MQIGTSEMVREMDKYCEEKIGIPLLLLMEHAALSLLKHVQKYERYIIVCGYGNNGGDGLALARLLLLQGKEVTIFLVGTGTFSSCANVQYTILKNMGAAIEVIKEGEDIHKLQQVLLVSDIVIDGILGTGVRREITGRVKEVIETINAHGIYTVAIDVPSGLNGDTGKVMGIATKANKTICFEVYKRGFVHYDAYSYIGEVVIEPIGVPKEILSLYDTHEYMTDIQTVKAYIQPRNKVTFKSNYGKILLVAGSRGFDGAAYICTQAAVKTGSGLVTLMSEREVVERISLRVTEAMTTSFEELSQKFGTMDCIGFGPGMGHTQHTKQILQEVLSCSSCPLVIDADGLNVLANNLDMLALCKREIILTPHLGEMARLTGLSIEEIRQNRIDVAKNFAIKYGVIVLLKGYQTIITNGKEVYVNPTGNSAMANGGMGDTLTGIITSFVGQGIPPLMATVCGAYIHGYAGDVLSTTDYSVQATEIIAILPKIIKQLIES